VSNVRNASGFKAGNTVLSNINSKSPAEREDELRKMMNQYPEIKKEFLPDLRYAEIIVTALEPRHSDGELKEMATAQPQSLKVEELLYAATLYNDFETKAAIYESAAKIYPDQWNALNNAAAANITKGDFNKAEALLNKANTLKPNQPDVLNNLGVIAAHKGDFDKASEYFKKAEQNNANVAYNQAVLGVRNGEYNASAITKRTCDYNLALSQMLNKDYSAAQKTLECSEKDSQTYYLMGVVGARTNNKSMMIDNLSKSFKEDPSFKETAAKDAEFINFIDDADFQALLK
ncbi:MAG: tetratricopeptide repeat protein, partial [Bacteroidales bacterium]|nr:tetratricopeptide repeat protein [Bacteroidales bacterium]